MSLPDVGHRIWINCQVRPGPFSDERVVKVRDWVGFVPAAALRTPVEAGETQVMATVVSVDPETLTVALPGESPIGRILLGPTAELAASGSL